MEVSFDIKVIDTDMLHLIATFHSPKSVLESGAKGKKRIYEHTVVERRDTNSDVS